MPASGRGHRLPVSNGGAPPGPRSTIGGIAVLATTHPSGAVTTQNKVAPPSTCIAAHDATVPVRVGVIADAGHASHRRKRGTLRRRTRAWQAELSVDRWPNLVKQVSPNLGAVDPCRQASRGEQAAQLARGAAQWLSHADNVDFTDPSSSSCDEQGGGSPLLRGRG